MPTVQRTPQAVLAYLSIYLIWGSTYLAIYYALQGFPPFLLSGIRYLFAGLLLLLWAYSNNERALGLIEWWHNALSGSLALIGGIGMVAWSEQYITSAEAAVAGAATPFWFLLLDRANFKKNFSNKKLLLGLLIGFIGLLVFVITGKPHPTLAIAAPGVRTTAFIGITLGGICWVVGSLYMRDKQSQQSMVMNVSQQLLLAGLGSCIIASLQGEWRQIHWSQITLFSWLNLIYLAVFGSAVAYIAYVWLLKHGNATLVSTHIFINPVIAVILGAIFLQQGISAYQFAGMALILFGLFLTVGLRKITN